MFPLLIIYADLGTIPNELFLKQVLRPVLFYSNCLLFVPLLLLKRKLVLYVIVSFLFLCIYNYFTEAVFHNFFDISEQIPFKNMSERRRPIMRMRFVVPAVFSLTVYLLGGIYALVIDFYKRERASRAIEHEKTDIKLQFLRNQLNPHFLFNSLNSIYSLVRSKSDDAPEAVITLSELMRYMLYEANDKEVLLEKELNYVQNYISLQRLRIKNSKDVNINIHGDPKALLIYPLILITFIENAFKFGRDFKGQTYIDIKIRIVDHQLHFYVKNAIGIPKETTESSGIGLENIKKQLQYLYENQHSLTINSDKDYYEVDLTLNLNTA
jgi:LytS/YehU family sensor histidine kinase